MSVGPKTELAELIHKEKYRGQGETFYEAMCRLAGALSDGEEHRKRLKEILLEQRFLPGGRIQSAVGAVRVVTPYNCFVSGTIEDSYKGIIRRLAESGETMRKGGGIGYDFSTLRPRHATIVSTESKSSGPVSFMQVYDANCATLSSAGNRRGAQMAVLRCDHPDIEEFIHAKQNSNSLKHFNLSVGVTDAFMSAVMCDTDFELKFNGKVYKRIKAKALWDEIMRSTWDWAEPGVLFIDTINRMNNLYYCETIAATNPCGEQPLPPYGACLLGSINLVKYVKTQHPDDCGFDYCQLEKDIVDIIRAMDNVIDCAIYPLPQQEREAKLKRRMGIGVTGLANAVEFLSAPYGSKAALDLTEKIMSTITHQAYCVSVELAKEKGPFPLFDKPYLFGNFIKTLPDNIRADIDQYGIRNSHLISIAPTGTISLTADNVSSGIEPVYSYEQRRTVITDDGPREFDITDYGYSNFGVSGKTTDEVSVDEHLQTLLTVQKYVDSAVSKTCNVGDSVSWDEFKDVYVRAWLGGAKGLTTFRAAGMRMGIIKKRGDNDEPDAACYIDESGKKQCGD